MKRWQHGWIPGMQSINIPMDLLLDDEMPVTRYPGDCACDRCARAIVLANAGEPDPDDACTLGGVLGLVRTAHGDATIVCEYVTSSAGHKPPYWVVHLSGGWSHDGATEFDALKAALDASVPKETPGIRHIAGALYEITWKGEAIGDGARCPKCGGTPSSHVNPGPDDERHPYRDPHFGCQVEHVSLWPENLMDFEAKEQT